MPDYGYRHDKRAVCVQIVVALIVTPEGFPLAHEVLPGNTAECLLLGCFIVSAPAKNTSQFRHQLMLNHLPPLHYS